MAIEDLKRYHWLKKESKRIASEIRAAEANGGEVGYDDDIERWEGKPNLCRGGKTSEYTKEPKG